MPTFHYWELYALVLCFFNKSKRVGDVNHMLNLVYALNYIDVLQFLNNFRLFQLFEKNTVLMYLMILLISNIIKSDNLIIY